MVDYYKRKVGFSKEQIVSFVLLVLYSVGLVGSFTPFASFLYQLTAVVLLLSTVLMLWCHSAETTGLLFACSLVFLIGFGIEVLGVNTGKIFGVYAYGNVLGPKLWQTPLMIGVNWLMLSYAAHFTVRMYLPKAKAVVLIGLASVLVVFLDVIMEPVAMHTGMWGWQNDVVPLQNYVAWFVVSVVIQLVFVSFLKKGQHNKIAPLVFLIQFIFFGVQLLQPSLK